MTPTILQAVLGGVKCDRMASAWRNRSNVTQCDWAYRCRELFGDIPLGELHTKAACVYAACGWYANGRGSDIFDGANVPARGWILIAVIAGDFLIDPPDKAMGRWTWETRRKSQLST
jgi:hypothetical protein